MTGEPEEYLDAHVQRLLAEHGDVAEQGIRVVRRDHTLVLCGTVASPARRDAIIRLVEERFPGVPLDSDIAVASVHPPPDREDLR
jgi:hypothetical protein